MTDEAMSPLRRRMIEDMTIRKLAPKTQQGYIRIVKEFAAFLGRSPDTASFEDVRRFNSRMQMTPDERNELQIRRICRAYEWQQRSVSISYAPRSIVSMIIERLSSILAVRIEWSRKMVHFISRSEKCPTRSAMMIVFLYLVDWRTTRAITTCRTARKARSRWRASGPELFQRNPEA